MTPEEEKDPETGQRPAEPNEGPPDKVEKKEQEEERIREQKRQ